jgi:hypothetical protein
MSTTSRKPFNGNKDAASMTRSRIALAALVLAGWGSENRSVATGAQQGQPIVDMHLHARPIAFAGKPPAIEDDVSAATHMMRKRLVRPTCIAAVALSVTLVGAQPAAPDFTSLSTALSDELRDADPPGGTIAVDERIDSSAASWAIGGRPASKSRKV